MPRPNILYIHSHDTGRYVQPYGHAVPTPNIQRLAEEGVLFRRAFCAAPTCSASRAAMLTGQSAHSSGMIGLAHRGFRLDDYGQHVVHTLRAAGYGTTLAGVQHEAPEAAMIGYDEILRGSDPAESAARFLAGAAGEGEPFFLSVGFVMTHRAFPSPASGDERFVLPPPPLPDTPETRRDMAAFIASARLLDAAIGRVLGALDASGRAADTLVICTTDHGIAFPGMKCNLTDHGIGVMLILRWPGGFAGGRGCDALVSQIDLFPTICDIIGVEHPPWLQGRSILPVLRGEREKVNDEVYADVTYHAAYEPQRAVRTGRWKYNPPVRRPGPGRPAQLRRQPEQGRLDRPRLGGAPRARGGPSRPRLRPERGAQRGGRSDVPRRARRHARAAGPMDAPDGRSVARRARPRAERRAGERPRRKVAGGAPMDRPLMALRRPCAGGSPYGTALRPPQVHLCTGGLRFWSRAHVG